MLLGFPNCMWIITKKWEMEEGKVSFKRHLLSVYYVPGTVLDAETKW